MTKMISIQQNKRLEENEIQRKIKNYFMVKNFQGD